MDEKCTVDPRQNCDVRDRVAQVEYGLTELRCQNSKTHESFGERIGDLEAHNKVQDAEARNLEKSVNSMADDVREMKKESKDMSKQLTSIESKVTTIHDNSKALDSDVEEIKMKPAKRWDNATGQIIGIIIAAVIGFFLAKLGLSG